MVITTIKDNALRIEINIITHYIVILPLVAIRTIYIFRKSFKISLKDDSILDLAGTLSDEQIDSIRIAGLVQIVDDRIIKQKDKKGYTMDNLKAILNLMDANRFRYGDIIMNGIGAICISFSEGRNFHGSWFEIRWDEKQIVTIREQIQYKNGEFNHIIKTTLKENESLYNYLSERLKKVKEVQNESG